MKQLITLLIGLSIAATADAQKIIKLGNLSGFPTAKASSYPMFYPELPNGKTVFMVRLDGTVWTLYTTDGTGTTELKDKGSENLKSCVGGGNLYLAVDDGTNGIEPWITDGSKAGTQLLKDINPGGNGFPGGDSSNMVYYSGAAYFSAFDGNSGIEPWRTSGNNNAQLVQDINPSGSSSPLNFVIASGKLFFSARLANTTGREMYVYNGGTATMINDLAPGIVDGVSEEPPIVYNDMVYFCGRGMPGGLELHLTNGTNMPMVKDINPGGDSNPRGFYIFNNKLYFTANDGTHGDELWVTNGINTDMVKDIEPGANGGYCQVLGDVNGKLIIARHTAANGRELWVSDGQVNGTTEILKDINPGAADGAYDLVSHYYSRIGMMTINNTYNDILYFAGDDGANGRELWQTDGTKTGTVMVEDYAPGSASSNLYFIQVSGNKVYLGIDDGTNGIEPCVYKAPAQSVADMEDVKTTMVYPTLNNGTFKVSLGNEYFRYGYLQVVDMVGRIVYDQSIPAGQKTVNIMLNDIAPGMYLVNIKLDKRAETHAISIIK
jgi:ELWxxDGT repeat protein